MFFVFPEFFPSDSAQAQPDFYRVLLQRTGGGLPDQ